MIERGKTDRNVSSSIRGDIGVVLLPIDHPVYSVPPLFMTNNQVNNFD